MGGKDTDLLATAEDMQSLVDPGESLSALVAGISELQQQIQQIQQHPPETVTMAATGDAEEQAGSADDAYRGREAGDAKRKVMSSMLLARPAATSVQEDMERLVGRLRREIGKIEVTLTDKMDRVEDQIKNLPNARAKGDDSGMLEVATGESGEGEAQDVGGADSDDMELCSSSATDVGGPYDSRIAQGASSISDERSRMKAAAAMAKVARNVSSDSLVRTIWVCCWRCHRYRRCKPHHNSTAAPARLCEHL